ncbi:uncharacterized protein C2845_PM18G02770 [Panicum miliaceum]|uniref:Uncharacterized protein n=1 Tax=Panicum miliaceum TaxID=4540 RepID=A0A498FAK9_PANMI|nr:uncharacterized protein C2845_PM18G02770 [Panicum miliaceum]
MEAGCKSGAERRRGRCRRSGDNKWAGIGAEELNVAAAARRPRKQPYVVEACTERNNGGVRGGKATVDRGPGLRRQGNPMEEESKRSEERKPASIKGRNLINYAVGLLGSESPEEYLSGARLLGAFVEMGEDVRSLLLPSRPKIQKLIDTLRWRSSPNENREIRELAATIVADLAGDIDLAQYPGAIRCMSSLLQEETTQTYWNRNKQVPHPQLHQKRV